jgi:hypothetical protein
MDHLIAREIMFFWCLRSVGRGEIHALVSTFEHTSLVLGLGLSFHTKLVRYWVFFIKLSYLSGRGTGLKTAF